ncbi:MAG: UTP--glucose-1-phosphate uridylyltransferase GalU [Acidimicrobiaceae bacterium]|nr:UTP--glucose-1-phosphate uridylyltransferase GalU [Acidimicrobiaceae bacterium]
MVSTVRKAVIPAAGLGTRFLPATKSQPKEMLPLVDMPAIQYVVEEAVRAGIRDVLIITGRGKRTLEDHFDRSLELEANLDAKGRPGDVELVRSIAQMATIHYVRQGEPLGLAHAVGLARKHIGDEPFAVLLGDDIMHERSGVLEGMIKLYSDTGRSVVAFKEVPMDEILMYGCASCEPVHDNIVRLLDLVEKPDPSEAPSNLAVMGRYILTPEIFNAIDEVKPGKGGELQLTDAIRLLLGHQDVFGYTFRGGRFDTGNKLDFLRATVEIALEREDIGPAFWEYLERRLKMPRISGELPE